MPWSNSNSHNSSLINPKKANQLKELLDPLVEKFNRSDFIEHDPISIPHSFSKKQDIEIAAFWTAILSWGRRATIISKAKDLFNRMDSDPYNFILTANDREFKVLESFKHRTFQFTDTLHFIQALRKIYTEHNSMESLFAFGDSLEMGLNHFYHYFFDLEFSPRRTQKHIAAPSKKSSCKRLNMFLRWMVRKDNKGVDFGIWNKIKPSQLFCPLDIHVYNNASQLGLLKRKQRDWKAVLELSENLRVLNSKDPVKYDFALFGLGIEEKYRPTQD